MQCDSDRACVFPAMAGGVCRYHLQDEEYPFSLPEISSMYRAYSSKRLGAVAVDHGEATFTGFTLGWFIDFRGFPSGRLWNKGLRYGGWKRKTELWISLDKLAAKRKRERTARPWQLRTEEDKIIRAAEIGKQNQEHERLEELHAEEVERRQAERHTKSKWGVHVDACANLLINHSLTFAAHGDTRKFASNLRAILSQSAATTMGRWSVKPLDSAVVVTKIGSWDMHSAHI